MYQGQYGFNNNDPSVKYAPSMLPQVSSVLPQVPKVPSMHPVVQQPIITQQPGPTMMNANNTVVINQGGQVFENEKPRRWSSGKCECFRDLQSCCLVYWLGDLYGLCWAARVNENFCLPICCPDSWMGAVRTKIRTEYNIEGSVMKDLCVTHPVCVCCRPCAFCQMIREVDTMTARGYPIP